MVAEIAPFPVIMPLVMRHAQDAAFYWSQLDGSLASTTLGFERYAHFDRQLSAHLFGLKASGAAGFELVLAALRRWKKPGEAFVYAWLGFQHPDAAVQDSVLAELDSRADELLRGAISALAFLPPDSAVPLLARFSAANATPLYQVVALRAAALLGPAVSAPVFDNLHSLRQMLGSSDHHVRASACRYLGTTGATEWLDALSSLLEDPVCTVRAEAAIACAQLGETERATQVLSACLLDVSELHATSTGWSRKQSLRRLGRWARHLAMHANAELVQLLPVVPAQTALTLILYRGEMTHIGYVLDQLEMPVTMCDAVFVCETLTGIDLEAAGALVRHGEDERGQGIVTVDTCRVRELLESRPNLARSTGPVVSGQQWNAELAQRLLHDGVQAIRLLAATRLRAWQRQLQFNVRARASWQRQQLRALAQ